MGRARALHETSTSADVGKGSKSNSSSSRSSGNGKSNDSARCSRVAVAACNVCLRLINTLAVLFVLTLDFSFADTVRDK